jgi:hypothetical protein
MRRISLTVLLASTISTAAIAEDGRRPPNEFATHAALPAAKTTVSELGNIYGWIDGSWRSINLPSYDLGWRVQVPINTGAPTAVHSSKPRLDGWAMDAGIGFRVPGLANGRFELSGLLVGADASESGAFVATAAGNGQGLQGVNGQNMFGNACGPPCAFTSDVRTEYRSWQVRGRYALDYRAGGLMWTPSLGVFGGRTDVNQDLSQRVLFSNGASGTYRADSDLESIDWGANLGVEFAVPLTKFITLGLGGTAGLAHRSVALSASDFGAGYLAGNPVPFGTSASAVAADASVTAFLASASARLTLALAPGWSLSTFGGLNFDNKVAGISAPGTPNPVGGNVTTTPAGIKFESEISYFAGSSLVVKF